MTRDPLLDFNIDTLLERNRAPQSPRGSDRDRGQTQDQPDQSHGTIIAARQMLDGVPTKPDEDQA